ncbi:MAG: preprotein translocase subunit YajC [Planctomycetota bacterium]
MSLHSHPTLVLPTDATPRWEQDPSNPEPQNGPAPEGAQGGSPQGGSGEPLPVTRESVNGEADNSNAGTEQDGDANKQQQGNPTDCLTDNLPLLIGFPLILYFLVIRPAQKQEKARKEMQATLGKGSKIVTTGGMHGTVASIDDGTVTLKVHGDQRLTFDRSAIGRILDGGTSAESKDSD